MKAFYIIGLKDVACGFEASVAATFDSKPTHLEPPVPRREYQIWLLMSCYRALGQLKPVLRISCINIIKKNSADFKKWFATS